MSRYEILTVLILVVSAVIAFVELVRRRRLNDARERMRRAVPSADVRVTLEGPSRDARFVVMNWGDGPARNVDFKIKKRGERSSPLVKGDYEEKLPIRELLAGDRVTFIAALTFETGTTFDTVLTWTNGDGTEQTREMQVSLT
jgi:hypothetical protein